MHIRQGTTSDLSSILALHYTIFTPEDHLLMVFGESVVERAYRWFIDTDDTFALVAEDDGRLGGFCTVSTRPYTRPMLLNVLPSMLASTIRRPRALLDPKLRARVKELLKRKRPDGLSGSPAQFGILAVHPDHQGTTVPTELVTAAVEECRRRGCDRLIAGIYKDNLAARFHFMKLGFTEEPSWETDSLVFMQNELDDRE